MSSKLKYVMGLFFEKKIPNKKNNLFLILNFIDFIILTVDYFTEIELTWLFMVVTLAILLLSFSIHIDERKLKIQKR
ncbi:hypothetical protein FQP34_20990 [Peribacillus simplex]|uniref:Uncharacterized protein n=1 Tax=Peribacillus simplex TaxID=1478 RepID=A0A8B5XTT5_9BACI|nr:hypothetical protein [Peribacillus simplex]TVX77630.1 hypothetical protein FQP34_20990 [Peribacillus simplex]